MKREDMYKWNVATTKEYGVQEAISPQKQECEYTHINRINLKAGDSHIVSSEGYESASHWFPVLGTPKWTAALMRK